MKGIKFMYVLHFILNIRIYRQIISALIKAGLSDKYINNLKKVQIKYEILIFHLVTVQKIIIFSVIFCVVTYQDISTTAHVHRDY